MINTSSGTPAEIQGEFRYPNALINKDTDYVKFEIYEYKPALGSGFGGTASGNASGGSLTEYNNFGAYPIGSKKSTIYLYMPEDIEAEYGAQWNGRNISNLGRSGIAAVSGMLGNDQTNLGDSFNKAFEGVKETSSNMLTQGTGVAKLVSELLQGANFDTFSVNDLYSVSSGRIFNPNTELIYEGPQMRTFSLNFKMSPKNKGEAIAVKNIVSCFKQAMLPRFNENSIGGSNLRAFVGVPRVIDVTFMTGNVPNRFVSQFKISALTNVNVSYTPDGAWATYKDDFNSEINSADSANGSPVATSLSLSFMELKMLYAEEIYAQGATY